MDAPETTHRRWFDLPAIAILAFLTVVACLAAWKWAESHNREQCLEALKDKGVVISPEWEIDKWSTDWPFHNARRLTVIYLRDGAFNDDDVRSLRRDFRGVPLYRAYLETANTYAAEPLDPELDAE